jgi:DNA-binding winged helix-turn-helix (wHTH) protein/tetratricopeptide (TPR) repeat protein
MIYRFGSCELDADRRELRRDGRPLSVEPRVFELLAYLVENRDRILTKDEINREVWDSRIVSDAALSSCIKSVRQAIGDDGKTQALVRTAHGRGFHFIADVECDEPGNIGARPRSASDAIVHATGADYVIEGSVRKRDARVRVNVQLVDARGGGCIWSENYDRECADIFEVQDSITQTIAARLEPAIGVEERRKISRTVGSRDLRAWEAYHLGIAHLFKFTETDNLRAQELLQKARELDPAFGDAHAWWAYAVVLGTVYWAVEATSARLDEALDATQTALEIDDSNSTFYALKARVQLARQEYESAIEGNKLAIELNPTFAAAHCGLADSLTYLGRYDEAIRQFEHAIALSSNDPQRWAFFTYGALAFIFKGDFERAVEWADRAAEIPNHQYWTYAHKAVALALMGKEAEARHALAAALAKQPRLSVRYARERLYYLKDTAQLDRYAEGLERAGASIT